MAFFLPPDTKKRQKAAIVKRLDRIDCNIQRLECDVGIANKVLATFMHP